MIKYTTELSNYNELDDLLWSGAKDRWLNATDSQKEEVWNRLEEYLIINDDATLTLINDFIWFECDDIFYGE